MPIIDRNMSNTIPASAGIDLRAQHYQEVLEQKPSVGWFEVHSEIYFSAGGRPHYYLEKIPQEYPLSLHGVGLSIGSAVGGRYSNDLIPIPYTEEALNHIVGRIQQVQDYLGRQILIENVSNYLKYTISPIHEVEFINEIANQVSDPVAIPVSLNDSGVNFVILRNELV
jgi:hypothetical protein